MSPSRFPARRSPIPIPRPVWLPGTIAKRLSRKIAPLAAIAVAVPPILAPVALAPFALASIPAAPLAIAPQVPSPVAARLEAADLPVAIAYDAAVWTGQAACHRDACAANLTAVTGAIAIAGNVPDGAYLHFYFPREKTSLDWILRRHAGGPSGLGAVNGWTLGDRQANDGRYPDWVRAVVPFRDAAGDAPAGGAVLLGERDGWGFAVTLYRPDAGAEPFAAAAAAVLAETELRPPFR